MRRPRPGAAPGARSDAAGPFPDAREQELRGQMPEPFAFAAPLAHPFRCPAGAARLPPSALPAFCIG